MTHTSTYYHASAHVTSSIDQLVSMFRSLRTRTDSASLDCEKLKTRHAGTEARNGRPRTTHCSRGHERTEENTYWKQHNGSKRRECKLCVSQRVSK